MHRLHTTDYREPIVNTRTVGHNNLKLVKLATRCSQWHSIEVCGNCNEILIPIPMKQLAIPIPKLHYVYSHFYPIPAGKCVVTEVFLFSIITFKTQGSVATYT